MKQHYKALDGLRGVAALMVLGFHLFEAVAFAAGAPEQKMFHGFLAVDFFLILSGFVMGYAYDDQWTQMSVGKFFRKRLIRLHPMVVMGVVIGLVVFLGQGCLEWDGSQASWGMVALSALLAFFLLPSPLGVDVRGNGEMFPLNGPHWSLFFEYIGSILYALLLRRLSTRALKVWVVVAGFALLGMGLWIPGGSIGFGWSSQPINALGGLARMSFDYPMGLLLVRLFNEKEHKQISELFFWPCALALVVALCVPNIGAASLAYQLLCVCAIFPAIIWLGAKCTLAESESRILPFLGQLSYPLYAVHYPFIYLYIGWINSGTNPFGPYPWCTPQAVAVISILTAVLCMKFYDAPVRKWLNNK